MKHRLCISFHVSICVMRNAMMDCKLNARLSIVHDNESHQFGIGYGSRPSQLPARPNWIEATIRLGHGRGLCGYAWCKNLTVVGTARSSTSLFLSGAVDCGLFWDPYTSHLIFSIANRSRSSIRANYGLCGYACPLLHQHNLVFVETARLSRCCGGKIEVVGSTNPLAVSLTCCIC